MGLQDETYSIRLMLTELKVPELLIEILVFMQDSSIGEAGDDLYIQGLKVLYQLCKGNFPGQAQITKGLGWKNMQKLIKGNFSVFNILFLTQIFEEDTKYFHINKQFSLELMSLFSESFDNFFNQYSNHNRVSQANSLVSLFAFKSLLSLFIKENNIKFKYRQAFNLPICKILHKMVIKFAIPLFRDNKLKFDEIYEPKLINKKWKLEDGSFLVSLMMLTGDHIK